MTKKPYEMNFAEFAEAISPGHSCWLTKSMENSTESAGWLTRVWKSTDVRKSYGISWGNAVLRNALPLKSRLFQFDDLQLFPVIERFGLDIKSDEDAKKTAELLAIRNAWIASIQSRYGQSSEVAACFELSLSAAAEYVLLTSNWMQHPWIQWQVRQHIEEENLKKIEQESKPALPVEMSSNPLWPGTQVIHAKTHEPSAQYLARHDEEMKGIPYWLNKFKSTDGNWTSVFDIYVYDAEYDIHIANLKIAELKKYIAKQEALIKESNKIIIKNKKLEAAVIPQRCRGKPKKSTERREVVLNFISQWVQSLMDTLEVTSCAKMETYIYECEQRNWRRWLNREAIMTPDTLTDLLSAEIRQGSYKGKPLRNVPTTPEHNDLLSLIILI